MNKSNFMSVLQEFNFFLPPRSWEPHIAECGRAAGIGNRLIQMEPCVHRALLSPKSSSSQEKAAGSPILWAVQATRLQASRILLLSQLTSSARQRRAQAPFSLAWTTATASCPASLLLPLPPWAPLHTGIARIFMTTRCNLQQTH